MDQLVARERVEMQRQFPATQHTTCGVGQEHSFYPETSRDNVQEPERIQGHSQEYHAAYAGMSGAPLSLKGTRWVAQRGLASERGSALSRVLPETDGPRDMVYRIRILQPICVESLRLSRRTSCLQKWGSWQKSCCTLAS